MTKNEKRVIAVDAIILVVFLVISFVAPFKMNGVFWLSVIFGVISIVSQLYIMKIAFAQDNDVKSKFYGFPIAKIGVIYVIVQLILSLLFMVVCKFINIKGWIPTILYMVILAVAAIGCIANDATREAVKKLDEKKAIDTEWMMKMRAIVASLPSQTEDAEIKKMLEKLAEEFKYSDPVSCEGTKDYENQIDLIVSELKNALENDNQGTVDAFIKKLTDLVSERNIICKNSK